MRLEPRAVLVGALLVCACVAPQLALGDSSGRSDGRDWNEPSTAPPPHPPNFDDALAPELARIERQHAERRTEGARRMRERSRTAYAALSGPDALDLARQQFPSVFESPIWRGPEAPPGGRIRRFLSDHSYLVDQPNGPTELVQSLDPVLDKDAAGHDAPIDTRLHQSANGFAPANTLTPVQVAGDAAGSSSLERAGIAFHLVGGDSSARATIAGDKAFYPEAVHDSDLTVAPVPDGLEVLLQLRSQQSPEDAALKFDMPPGAELRLTQEAPITTPDPMPRPEQAEAHVYVGGRSVATIHAPVASDADGMRVPASYRVEGDRLIIHVPHSGGDWHYPILVDPLVVDDYHWKERNGTGNGGSAQSQGWGYRMSGSTGFSAYDCSQLNCAPNSVLNGPGLYLSATAGPYGPYGPFADWFWQAPRNSNIVRVDWRLAGLTTAGTACLNVYVTGTTSGSQPNRQSRCGNMTVQTWWPVSCVDKDHPCGDTGYSQPNNQAVFEMQLFGNHPATTWSALGGADIYLWEGGRPIVQKLVEPQSTTKDDAIQWYPPTAWVDENYSKSFRVLTHDNELGVWRADFYIDGASAGGGGLFCDGKYSNVCPQDVVLPASAFGSAPFSISAGSLSEGVHHLSVVATDIIRNSSTGQLNQEWDIRIDKTRPTVSVGNGTVKSGAVLGSGTQTLVVNGNDVGAGGVVNSGVQSFLWWVDGSERPQNNVYCASGPCSTTFYLDTTASGLSEGWHTIKLDAKDAVLHLAQLSQSFGVVVDRNAPTASVSHQGLPAQWVDAAAVDTTVTGADSGAGVKRAEITAPNWTRSQNLSECANSSADHCPATGSKLFHYTEADLNDGDNSLTAKVYDAAGRPSAATAAWHVKLDRTPPDIVLSDALANADGQQISDSTYNLHVHATDGTSTPAAAARSGVNSIEVLVDGDSQYYDDQPCQSGSCSMDRDWTLDGASLDAGSHTIEVVATDQLGHERTRSLTVTKSCCLSPAASAGTVTPVQDVRFADVDGDGVSDMVTRDSLTGAVDVRLSDAGEFGAPQGWGVWSAAYSFAVTDVDGDGAADLVGRNSVTGDLSVGVSTSSSFNAGVSWGAWPGGDQVSFVDVDGDGASDVVGYDAVTGLVRVGYSNPAASFEPPLQYTVWNTSYSVAFADVTGDDAADIVGRNPATGDVRVGVSDAGAFVTPSSWGTASNGLDVAFDDVNGDGLADMVTRDGSSGAVAVSASDGLMFGSPSPWGTFATGYALGTADVSGDSRADLVGVNALVGDIAAAQSTATVPAGDPAPDITLDPTVPVQDDVSDSSGSNQASAAAASSGSNTKPLIAAEADNFLLYRNRHLLGLASQSDDAFGNKNAEAEDKIAKVYARMRQMGATAVRFQVFWGRHENRVIGTDPDTGAPQYAGGTHYYWDKLDRAVTLARNAGFTHIELTFTGYAKVDECQNNPIAPQDVYNPNGMACTGDGRPTPSGVDPDPSSYGRFVEAGVRHFTRASDGFAPDVRVDTFSFWNEPNEKAWLKGKQVDEEAGKIPARLYRSLYLSAYSGYLNATKLIPGTGEQTQPLQEAVHGTQVLLGELSSGNNVGRMEDGPRCTNIVRAQPKCQYSPVDFLNATVKSTDGTPYTYFPADGVSLHPYQDRLPPWQAPKGNTKRIGIGNLGKLIAASEALFKQGKLKSRDDKRPGLYLTEFGYQSSPQNAKTAKDYPQLVRKNNYWHTEATRASWFAGTSKNPVKFALYNARHAEARWMLLWEVVEADPGADDPPAVRVARKYYKTDYGLFSSPAFTPPLGAVTGQRLYGKRYEHSAKADIYRYPQRRQAYCAIRKWAAGNGYLGSPVNSSLKNACPKPASAHASE